MWSVTIAMMRRRNSADAPQLSYALDTVSRRRRVSGRIASVREHVTGIHNETENARLARMEAMTMKTWNVYWSPEGRVIATVQARTARAAIRKAPYPYRRYLGELYAEEV